jgi:hypothetical protein
MHQTHIHTDTHAHTHRYADRDSFYLARVDVMKAKISSASSMKKTASFIHVSTIFEERQKMITLILSG